ncbi:MAG: PEP-utilizing enzyme [Patescibacteria group bacterium]
MGSIKKAKKFIDLLKLTDTHVALWDLKKAEMQKAFYYLDLLLREISKRFSLSFKDIKWYTPVEVGRLFDNTKINRREVTRRKNFCILEITLKGVNVITGLQARRLASRIEKSFLGNQTKIEGQVANPGIINGIVRVIINPNISTEFKKGSVLITGMTTPDFIPFMKKASAIITDEGGITCHAAIVSRELGIPCIIGTKNATKLLKDGDRVEVDANKGIVRQN